MFNDNIRNVVAYGLAALCCIVIVACPKPVPVTGGAGAARTQSVGSLPEPMTYRLMALELVGDRSGTLATAEASGYTEDTSTGTSSFAFWGFTTTLGMLPLYRLRTQTTEYLTPLLNERDAALNPRPGALNFLSDGVAFYVFWPTATEAGVGPFYRAVYRASNPRTGDTLLANDVASINAAVGRGYVNNGLSFKLAIQEGGGFTNIVRFHNVVQDRYAYDTIANSSIYTTRGYFNEGVIGAAALTMAQADDWRPLYALYNANLDDYMYTVDLKDFDNQVNFRGYKPQGVTVYLGALDINGGPANNATAQLISLQNYVTGHHYYTTDRAYANTLTSSLNYIETSAEQTIFVNPPADAIRVERLVKPLETAPVLKTKDLLPLYRLWEPYKTGSMMYTTDSAEGNSSVKNDGYYFIDIEAYVFPQGGSLQPDNTVPVFRLFNQATKDYILTTNPVEQQSLVSIGGYSNQGMRFIAFTAAYPGTVPIYRRRSVNSGQHMFNVDPAATANSGDTLADEGIAFYVYGPLEGAFISDFAAGRIGPQFSSNQLQNLYGFSPTSQLPSAPRRPRARSAVPALTIGVDVPAPTDGTDDNPDIGDLIPSETGEDVGDRSVHQSNPQHPQPPAQLIPDNSKSYTNPNGLYVMQPAWLDYLATDEATSFVDATDTERASPTDSMPSDADLHDPASRFQIWSSGINTGPLRWVGLQPPAMWASPVSDPDTHWVPLLRQSDELRHNMIREQYSGNDISSVAHRLGGIVFDGWQYGTPGGGTTNPNYKIDCDTFMLTAVEAYLGQTISTTERAIFLSNFNASENQLIASAIASAAPGQKSAAGINERRAIVQNWVNTNDPRLGGLTKALADDLGVATRVSGIQTAQPGDLMQYWSFEGGSWRGHAAMIETITQSGGTYNVLIYSSQPRPAPGGVGEWLVTFTNPDSNTNLRIFIVRLK